MACLRDGRSSWDRHGGKYLLLQAAEKLSTMRVACDSVELEPRGDLPCADRTIGRKAFSLTSGWRSGFRRITRCVQSRRWRMRHPHTPSSMTATDTEGAERAAISNAPRAYCKLDSYALFAIWKKLQRMAIAG
jgi:hypothetical protein